MVKLCRPLGACHAVKIKIHLHVHSYMLLLLWKYASTYIHSIPSLDSPKSILLLIWERIGKNISVFSYEINARVILVTTNCYIISGDECSLKKREKKYEEIKRGKCPEPRRKEKMKREVNMDKCPTVELEVQDTHLREKKYRASHSPQKASKCKKGMYPLKRAKVELDFHHCYHHTPFTRHICVGYS